MVTRLPDRLTTDHSHLTTDFWQLLTEQYKNDIL
jgi:hypothetical protein